eukprot:scpid93411/ scgid0650/ 
MPRRSNIHNKIREDCTQETQSGQESIVKSVGKQVCVCVGARVSVCLVVNQSCVIEWAWVHMRGCECMEAHVWVCMRGCACVDVDVNAWMSMCGFTCVDVHVWMCTCGCACVDFYFHLFFIFLRSPLCCACVDVPVWVCMCGCACVCGPIVTDTPERVSWKNRGIVSDRLARGSGVQEDGEEERKKTGKDRHNENAGMIADVQQRPMTITLKEGKREGERE